jgi:hypothetical protein
VENQQRREPRTAFDGWVELRVNGGRRLASARDLARGGIGLAVQGDALALRDAVTCEFALPGISLPLELEGAVAWSADGRAGVRFVRVDPGLAELLENHVAGRL